MATVKAMTITVDSLLPRPKLDYGVGYDAAMKGASVVVSQRVTLVESSRLGVVLGVLSASTLVPLD
jgi:hypothetical protein